MILPLKFYKEYGWGKTLRLIGSGLISQLTGGFEVSKKQQSPSYFEPPRLRRNEAGDTLCVACELCAQACPTKAITVELESKINMPRSLKYGPAPKKFVIDEDLCVRCSICVEMCPVAALSPCVS